MARTVQDVLSGLAGIQIRNSTGAADTAAVDLRGFGISIALSSAGDAMIDTDIYCCCHRLTFCCWPCVRKNTEHYGKMDETDIVVLIIFHY